ncbi:MAG TPA: glucose-6-phosphate dehydrogenase assembly protein OpcA [Myxococcales bacterium]|nr:glucose-6-phosphate dehydrogenase assembly protein OpcA [Myxococcales bacterium]
MSDAYGEPISAGGSQHSGELTLSFDQAVDLRRIEAALHAARERGGPAPESVATLNLVAITFNAAQYERACPALEAAGTLHPCRLIALIADALIEHDSLSAAVSVIRSGGAVTMERIVLSATGRAVRHLESAMMGLLRPDLPMVVVWGGRPLGDLLHRVVESADRIVTDSGARPPNYLAETADLLAKGAPIGDLAWARIFPWQSLAADTLDLPNLREHRGNIRNARVVCAGAVGAEGLLLLGWMQSRIKRLEVAIEAQGAPDEDAGVPQGPIPRAAPMGLGHVRLLEFVAPPVTFTLHRESGLLLAEVKGDDDGYVAHRVRLPPELPGSLLALELKILAGRDELYAQSAQQAAKLLRAAKP